MQRMEFTRVGILGVACAMLATAFVGCGTEAGVDAGVDAAETEAALSSDCRDPAKKVSATFDGGVTPKNTSPTSYSDCPDARLIQVNDYATKYAIGGHTVVRWADTVPSGQEDCRNIYITAALYVKDGSKWTQIVSKKAHGDHRLDDEPSDVVGPPKQPAKPVTGPLQPVDPSILVPDGPQVAHFCNGPAVYFYGSEMEPGKTYRIAASARTTSSGHTLRKHSIQSVAGTCGQDALHCCTSGDDCDNGLTCVSKLCKPCGGSGEACCGGTSCDSSGLTCQSGTCKTCGGSGEACCSGSSCDSSGLTCQSGTCKNCGGSGEACCSGSSCDSSGLTCQSGTCKNCGASGEACCSGNSCDSSSLVCSSGSCKACGGTNQPCCGSSCGGGLTCQSGTCKTPACGGNGQPCCAGSSCPSPLYCQASTQKCFTTPGLCDAPGKNCCGPDLAGGSAYCKTDFFPNLRCNGSTCVN